MPGQGDDDDLSFSDDIASSAKDLKSTPGIRLKFVGDSHQAITFAFLDFGLFALVNTIAALYAPILDCDEVFNYWEPTHYLNYGFGLQTWEYSPEFALRSWLYILLHAIPGKIASLILAKGSSQLYFIRIVLGLVCAYCQTRLFCVISKEFGYRVGRIFEIVMTSSTGIFYASVAFLPSSFAMMTNMMGIAAFLDWRRGLKTSTVIAWFGAGAIVGWPFSAALIIPLLLEEAISIWSTGFTDSALRVCIGALRVLFLAALDFVTNAFFYRDFVFSPWRIISYNVFGGSSRGPNIFGTEPWHFYLRNLLLNFNMWFLLALSAGPLVVLQVLLRMQSTSRISPLRSLIFLTPFYLWLGIFSLQPHKEERFMYPAYPFLCLNASVSAHILLFQLGHVNPRTLLGKVPSRIRLLFVIGGFSCAVTLGVLRTAGTVTAYGAPLRIYDFLHEPRFVDSKANVCLGKEWYRFPSSYVLPKKMRAKFIKSAFDGLLPGQFPDKVTESSLLPTWVMPTGMNDQNIEDRAKYIGIEQCSFLVDSRLRDPKSTDLEPDFIGSANSNGTWDPLVCSRFLDVSSTHLISRIIWIPDLPFIPLRFQRQWGEYCLLRHDGKLEQ